MSDITLKIDKMLEEARTLINRDYDKGFKLVNEAYDLSKEIKYNKGMAWSTLRKGSYVLRKDQNTLALSFYFDALKQMEAIEDLMGVCRCHYSLATSYGLINQYDFALTHFLKALEYVEEYDPSYYSKVLNNLSNVYLALKQYDEAIVACEKSIGMMTALEDIRFYMPYTSLGDIYLAKGDYEQALRCADVALKYLNEKDESNYRSFANIIIAGAYKGLKYYDEALIVYNRALSIMVKQADLHRLSYIHREIADLYLIKKEYNYAFKHCQISLTEAIKSHSSDDEALTLLLYAKLYEGLENFKKAYESFKRGNSILEKNRIEGLEERYQALLINQGKGAHHEALELSEPIESPGLFYTLKEIKTSYQSIHQAEQDALTNAFVEAVVDTIDIRDTTTVGHSKRMAKYATEIMRVMNDDMIDYPEIYFSEHEIKKMYYSALLHDIGKLSVPENILLKDQRISEEALMNIECRYKSMRCILENKLNYDQLTFEEEEILENLEDHYNFIKTVALSYDVTETDRDRLDSIYNYSYKLPTGDEFYMLSEKELEALKIKKGNLTRSEWKLMRSHAHFTMIFLKKIPWAENLQSVPLIAGSHHEKLDGSGYPQGLKGSEISLEMRILAVVDIFEALTSKHRLYKPVFNIEDAINILKEEADLDKVDRKVIDFFVKHKICYLCVDEIDKKLNQK
jgi:HD-GYP domain-containing protein (c-di-GMP phosphodiesterase class II)